MIIGADLRLIEMSFCPPTSKRREKFPAIVTAMPPFKKPRLEIQSMCRLYHLYKLDYLHCSNQSKSSIGSTSCLTLEIHFFLFRLFCFTSFSASRYVDWIQIHPLNKPIKKKKSCSENKFHLYAPKSRSHWSGKIETGNTTIKEEGLL